MEDFIHTGFWAPTLTTPEDYRLKVIERDNGRSWGIGFYVESRMIDYIDLENLGGTKLKEEILNLSVYDEENRFLGSVRERLENAYSLLF